ncbi:MAG: SDR family oxidoreductase [Chloroflexi bacterium]|nr:SDR family oxidoreductase [Chloroflexota bacterium]MQC18856.1 SDR family oxidoreductase [Chloroflexota bacterium]
MSFQLTGLEDKVAIVTGAGRMRSIGRQMALAFAQAGCDVVVTGTGRSPDRYPDDEKAASWRDIESVADEVRALGRRALPMVMDVADESQAQDCIDRTVAELVRVDFLVNNAAAARGEDRVPVVDMDADTWDLVIRVKLRGSFLMSRAFARELLKQERPGAIVNISSIAGKRMGPNATAYSASNAGLQALSSGMSGELGPHGIRVNTICPGIIDTHRLSDLSRSRFDEIARSIPIGRASDGTDIAYMALFLCSDQGDWVTGQAINVDGRSMTAH